MANKFVGSILRQLLIGISATDHGTGTAVSMTTLSNIKEVLKSHKLRLSTKYGLNNIAIFGSYVRGQQTMVSDVDILVDFKQPIGIEFIDLAEELESLLKIKVDLVSRNGVKPAYYKQIEVELSYV